MDTLFWLTVVSGALAVIFSMVPSFVPVWSRGDDGKSGPTRAGQLFIGIAVISWLFSIAIARVQDHRADEAQAQAEAKAAAHTDSITRRIAGVLTEVHLIRNESETLRHLQRLALASSDSAAAVASGLIVQQQKVLGELGTSLALSRGISDTLQTGLVLSRQLSDSLQAAENSAVHRTRETLRMTEASRSPLNSIRSGFHIYIPRNANTTDLIDRLYAGRRRYRPPAPIGRRAGAYRFAPVAESGRWVLVDDGRPNPVLLPAGITLDFWRGDTECRHVHEPLIGAKRMLDYDSVDAIFLDGGIAVNWNEAEFEVQSKRNLTIDDLRGACVSAGFYGDPISSNNPVWRTVEFGGLNFVFPNGRTASATLVAPSNADKADPIVWSGRIELDR